MSKKQYARLFEVEQGQLVISCQWIDGAVAVVTEMFFEEDGDVGSIVTRLQNPELTKDVALEAILEATDTKAQELADALHDELMRHRVEEEKAGQQTEEQHND